MNCEVAKSHFIWTRLRYRWVIGERPVERQRMKIDILFLERSVNHKSINKLILSSYHLWLSQLLEIFSLGDKCRRVNSIRIFQRQLRQVYIYRVQDVQKPSPCLCQQNNLNHCEEDWFKASGSHFRALMLVFYSLFEKSKWWFTCISVAKVYSLAYLSNAKSWRSEFI